jgi:hypothetical protein
MGACPARRDDLVVIPSDGVGKERSDVNLSHLYVATHQDEMRKAAADERIARSGQIEQPSRLGAAAKSLWSLLSGPADRPVVLPTLTNYPFRG